MSADGALRVLVVTNLFPNNVDPGFAPFNRQQFAELGRLALVEVMAIVPWRYGRSSFRGPSTQVVRREHIDGLLVEHPRFFTIPGVPALNAGLMSATIAPHILSRSLARSGPASSSPLAFRSLRPSLAFDVILASYAYPDGCAGVIAGRALGIPVVVKCHGSDLNRVPEQAATRFVMRHVLKRASRVVTVSKKLRDRAEALGVPGDRIRVVYNGVDRGRFRPRDKGPIREKLGLDPNRPTVLFVGHLAEHKGARDLLTAADGLSALLPEARVVFAGDGPLRGEIEEAARRGRVGYVGHVPHEAVADYMAAADVLCLPSWDEGMPNVVREAHASGRPVVATLVGGLPEAVHALELGRLVPPRDPAALAKALAELLAGLPDPERVIELGLVPSWCESAQALHGVLLEASEDRPHRAPGRGI